MSKFICSCFLLVKNVSRDSGEILLSPWSPVSQSPVPCLPVCFVDPRLSMFPSASPRETSTVSGPQNILLPSVSVNKC